MNLQLWALLNSLFVTEVWCSIKTLKLPGIVDSRKVPQRKPYWHNLLFEEMMKQNDSKAVCKY